MRYEESQGVPPLTQMQDYSDSAGLHFMLNFTVALALLVGIVLLWLGRRGKVMWLQVWSVGLILFSIAYLFGAAMGWI